MSGSAVVFWTNKDEIYFCEKVLKTALIKMKILGLDHIHFTVKDLEEAIGFYTKLGFKLEKRLNHNGKSAQLRISPNGVIVDLHPTKPVENPGYNHITVSVEDLEAAVKELKEQGIELDTPIQVSPVGRRLVTIRDPSGFLFQLVDTKKE